MAAAEGQPIRIVEAGSIVAVWAVPAGSGRAAVVNDSLITSDPEKNWTQSPPSRGLLSFYYNRWTAKQLKFPHEKRKL